MGKKSKRHPEKATRSAPEDTEPPVFETPKWTELREALVQLKEWFGPECLFPVTWPMAEFCAVLQKRFDFRNIRIVNCTDSLPEGHEASHTVLSKVVGHLIGLSKGDPTQAYVLIRTRLNNPGFLGGVACNVARELGGYERAAEELKQQIIPAVLMLFQGKTIVLPTPCIDGTPELAARVLGAMADQDRFGFSCAFCEKSLLNFGVEKVSADVCVIMRCDHAYHPHCLYLHTLKKTDTCALCDEPLPFALVPNDEHPLRMIPQYHDTPEFKEKVMEKLTEDVKAAMIEDGLDLPEDK